MQPEERLDALLERWVAEAGTGRLLLAADLCRDCPDLLAEAENRIAVLRRFHLLAQPGASTSIEAHVQADTASGAPRHDLPGPRLPTPGDRFGRYQIVARLGGGGMGIVCKARDTQLARDVALKFMRPDVAAAPGTGERFLREARTLAAVRDDHVVEVYDQGEIDGVCFVVMPLLAGESLQTRLESESPLPTAEMLRIGLELTEGLAAVHARGLIHRDLKPSNVWLEAPHGRVKLLDFGLARDSRRRDGVTCPGAVVGTPAYMSPEQANGLDVDARSDLFSLGSVLYRAATGRAAFPAATLTATLTAVAEKEAPPACVVNPVVPVALSELIEHLHRKDPTERPASANEVHQQLRALAALNEMPTTDWQPARTTRNPRPRKTQRHLLAVVGTLGLLLILALFVSHRLSNRPQTDAVVPAPSPGRSEPADPLRVRALDVLHLASVDGRQTRPRLLIGKESFGASLDDDIKVSAHLSRPAYCYLIVFRPDGHDEVLYPQGAHLIPEQTDAPRYPSRDRSKVYGLTDGTGLWLIALVASDRPLPPYAQWRRQHSGGPWVKSEGEPGVVWLDDGQWLEVVTPHGLRTRGGRGEQEAATTTPIVRLVDWLKGETGGTVSAVGFTVAAKK